MRPSRFVLGFGSALGLAITGCSLQGSKFAFRKDSLTQSSTPALLAASQLEPSNANLCPQYDAAYTETVSPLDVNEASLTPENLLPLRLEECIQQALGSSRIMRDLGGTLLRSPQTTNTNMDPGLVFSDPRNGEEAALAAFDANFFVNNYFENNDRRLNNTFFGTGGLLNQELNTTQAGVNKRSATGGLFTFRNVGIYDRNNQTSNRFPYAWDRYVESEIRQPLLQGFGTEFNRIAGPGAAPGQLNGVLLARIRTDVSLTDFERSVRDLVAEVENAYWDLYYSYRDLESKIFVRSIAKDTLDKMDPLAEGTGKMAQAEEQVLRFQTEVIDALNGRPLDGTRTNNGSSGGTFRSTGGLRVAERKLRLMIGLPINDGRLLQPVDMPTAAPVIYDWNSCVAEAIESREELRRQRWVIKQRELELIANRNFLKPQLDLIGRYRFRGFGHDLFGNNSATDTLYNGDFQEWQVGFEYAMPVGFRKAQAAVQNSRLALAREIELLREQERYVHFGLSNAINDSKRAYENLQLQKKRLDAIVVQLGAIEAKRNDQEKAELDVRLETHRRLLDARLRFYQAEVEYILALRNVNYEKGSLLQYCNVALAESGAPPKAYMDAEERAKYRDYETEPTHRDDTIGSPRAQKVSFTDMPVVLTETSQ